MALKFSPQNVMFIRVTNQWYQMVKASYIATGSSRLNIWYNYSQAAEFEKISKKVKPGELVLFTLQAISGDMYVVGGGYLLDRQVLTQKEAWQLYGVKNGARTLDEFSEFLKAQDIKTDNIPSVVVSSCFIYSRADCLLIPSEFAAGFKSKLCGELNTDNPIGMYLCKIAQERRFPQLQNGRSENDWPGIYVMAAQRNNARLVANFNARLLKAYDFTCAISGCKVNAALEVAHIKTFFDENFHTSDNGIVMRSDLHSLFSRGYITAYYKTPKQVVIKVSSCLKEQGDDYYLNFDGKPLRLPEDKSFWPNPKYLEWHMRVRFENWLSFFNIQPVGLTETGTY
ncbi:MAG: HNH endonuclease [Succinivibrio sp.]|nr:HNH endonuclease [Succinivibrio sp.]